jgi:hypothetical protein
MKRQFLLWLDSFCHKPKFLKKMIEMSYWSDILDLHEEKQKSKTELDKKLENIEKNLSEYVNILRKSLLATTNGDSGVVMTQVPREKAGEQMIEMLRREKNFKDENIFNYLEVLGFDIEWLKKKLKPFPSAAPLVIPPKNPTKPKTKKENKNVRRQTAKIDA